MNLGYTTDTLVLNTRTAGVCGTEQHVTDIESTPGAWLERLMYPEATDFSVTFQ